MTDDIKKRKRMIKKKVKPRFRRQEINKLKKLANNDRWKKPRGINSDKADKMKPNGVHPKIGYSAPKEIRFMHPSGYYETRVFNTQQLESLPENHAIRIGRTVGKRKKLDIIKAAEAKGIKVLNR
ncbi:MAG: 50S ribosomal protein L32e [Candidatus Diapherotrites archaeon]|nr:50S ribosomal protein L32e [Candidatus Diapherotrites archaeon]